MRAAHGLWLCRPALDHGRAALAARTAGLQVRSRVVIIVFRILNLNYWAFFKGSSRVKV